MHSLKYGLKKYISEKMNWYINSEDFSTSVYLFRAVATYLKRKGFGKVDHHPPIGDQDLKRLYVGENPVFYLLFPCRLQNKVWFEINIIIIYARRQREFKTNGHQR